MGSVTAATLDCDRILLAGRTHFQRREIVEALTCFGEAFHLTGNAQACAYERWACWMMLGEFERAWKECDSAGPSYSSQRTLPGDRVVLQCLRGLGDALQFLRYLPQLKARCAKISIQAPPRLLPLFDYMPDLEGVEVIGQYVRTHDCEVEASDLPYLFRTSLRSIPPPLRMSGLPELPRFTRDGLRSVGIVWRAGEWNPSRSIPLSLLSRLTELPGMAFFSLQRGSDEDRSPLPGEVVNIGPADGDMVRMASAIQQLDLVIAVDTTVAHLAGSLGKEVWLLLPHAADWRWMIHRTESPWYPGMRLFRQDAPGNWNGAIEQVAIALRQEITVGPRIPSPADQELLVN
jgi:hypothetical protein